MAGIVALSIGDEGEYFTFAFEHGYEVYSFTPLQKKYKKDFINFNIICISTSSEGNQTAFAVKPLLSASMQYKVFLWNNFFGESECELNFDEPVCSVCIRKHILIIILSNSICLYDISQKAIQFEQLTSTNTDGAGEVTFFDEKSKIAICGLTPGTIQIFSQDENSRPIFIQAHQHPISFIRFSPDTTLVATASQKATLIRIFDTANGIMISVFRRGSFPSRIMALAFSPSNKWLVAISDKGTVHLFNAFERCTNEESPPKAISKLNINSMKCADLVFLEENLFIIVSSSGIVSKVEIESNSMRISSQVLAFAK